MKRNAINVLQKWKSAEQRTPFYLTGIKGVGKTYLAYDFVNSFFDSYLYLSFEHNHELVERFEALDSSQIFSALADYFEIPEEMLFSVPFIFDEVYLCPHFMETLWDLIKNRTDLYWIFLSSFDVLNPSVKEHLFCHTLFPLQFDEFLIALGKEWYVEVIQAHFQSKRKVPEIVHQELLSTFDEYLWLGGMPDVINEYLSMESYVNTVDRQFLQKQMQLFGLQSVPEESVGYKAQQVFSTIEEQLKKENQKFQFNLIRKGITYQMYQPALEFLETHNMVYRINKIDNSHQFKLYYPDFSMNSSCRNDELTAVERHLRLQNYLYQTMVQANFDCYFWEAKSQATVDFIIKRDEEYIPVELKAEGKSKRKSIHSFGKEYTAQKSLKFSASNFVESDEETVLPVYSLFCFLNCR